MNEKDLDPHTIDIEALVRNREAFDRFVYTPPDEAVEELMRRRKDEALDAKVTAWLGEDIPEPLRRGPHGVAFRQLTTSNYEIRRFFSIIDSIEHIEPLFFEYLEDKFTSNNEWKHSLGRLFFFAGKGKKGGSRIDSLTIVDFNKANGKKLSEVETLWGQDLVSFHHELFKARYREADTAFFDASEWFKRNGPTPLSYYRSFLMLFVRHGILFENFLIDEKELEFTRDIFLPAFITAMQETGKKPLVVNLEPTEIEGDRFWMCHPREDREFVENKLTATSQ
ncbi:hypothetical protein K2Y00_00415 [Patescibacteria group bacterium]|nr:hypothetical protein [Patescibacteria group bacterium]